MAPTERHVKNPPGNDNSGMSIGGWFRCDLSFPRRVWRPWAARPQGTTSRSGPTARSTCPSCRSQGGCMTCRSGRGCRDVRTKQGTAFSQGLKSLPPTCVHVHVHVCPHRDTERRTPLNVPENRVCNCLPKLPRLCSEVLQHLKLRRSARAATCVLSASRRYTAWVDIDLQIVPRAESYNAMFARATHCDKTFDLIVGRHEHRCTACMGWGRSRVRHTAWPTPDLLPPVQPTGNKVQAITSASFAVALHQAFSMCTNFVITRFANVNTSTHLTRAMIKMTGTQSHMESINNPKGRSVLEQSLCIGFVP